MTSGRSATGIAVVGLAAAGCILLLLGTFLPYVTYSGGDDYAVFDVDHLGTTWPYGLSYLVAVAAVPVVWILSRRHPRVFGAFLLGLGLVVFLDFLGAFVIGPTTFEGSADLRLGGVLGTIGGALLVAAGVTALAATATGSLAQDAIAPPETVDERRWSPRRSVLVLLLAAITVNAVLGVIAVLFGDFDDSNDLAVKTVASSLCVTAAILAALACGSALRSGALRPLPLVGIALSAGGFGTVFAGVWGQWSSEQFWKIATTLVIGALSCAVASLVAQVNLPPLHPLRLGSFIAVLAFGIANVAAVWALTTSGEFWRMYGTIGLLLAGITAAAIVAGTTLRGAAATPPLIAE